MKTIKLTETEYNLLKGFLEDYNHILSTSGCNDMSIPNTPDNVAFVKAMLSYNISGSDLQEMLEELEDDLQNNPEYISVIDVFTLGYIRDKIFPKA